MDKSRYIFFLGSHPELSAGEAWRLLASVGYSPRLIWADSSVLIFDTPEKISTNFLMHLGGTDRIAQVVREQEEILTASDIVKQFEPWPDQKVLIGISGLGLTPDFTRRLGLEVKRRLRRLNHSVRIILPKPGLARLNAAQVIFNKLLIEPHREYTVIKRNQRHYLARTMQVQNISEYELRDTLRPARDAKVGMLPPKVAQIMLNLATTNLPPTPYPLHPKEGSLLPTPYPLPPNLIWDPFCGTGTIVQEGWLQGHKMIGSDLNAQMVLASRENFSWLTQNFPNSTAEAPDFFRHDATTIIPARWHNMVNAIVTEPDLGLPLSAPLAQPQAKKRLATWAALHLKFMETVRIALVPDAIIVMALPALRGPNRRFITIDDPWIDAVTHLGYRQIQLVPASLAAHYPPTVRGTLIYARPDAFVGRELIGWKLTSL